MSHPKKQRYVPQSYLRRFTQDGHNLHVFDKTTGKSFGPIGVENVAYSKYFYDIPLDAIPIPVEGKKIDPYRPEAVLAQLEGIFKEAIDAVLDAVAGTGTIGRQHLETMASCVAIQVLRTPQYRESIAKFMRKTTQVTAEGLLTRYKPGWEKDFKVKVDYPEESAAAQHAQHLWDIDVIERLATTLFNHIWIFGTTPPGMVLYTSDVPVIRIAHLPIEPVVNQDLASRAGITVAVEALLPSIAAPGVEIIYPLSSNCALMMLERTHFASMQDKHGGLSKLTAEDVEVFNLYQVRQCSRHIFCETPQFELASEVWRAYPEICSPDRDRIHVHGMSKHTAPKGDEASVYDHRL